MAADSHPRHHSDILFAITVLLGLAFAYAVRDVLLLIYVSALFAVVIGPALDAVQRLRIGRWHPSRGMAVLAVLGGVVGLTTLFFTFAIPPIYRDLSGFAADLPRRISTLQQKIQNGPLGETLDLDSLVSHASSALGGAFGFFRGFFGGVFAFFTALVLTAYFALDGERAFHWFLSMVSEAGRGRLESTLLRAELRLRRWLLGQAALMLILGISATVVFALIRLKYFYALGMLAGMLNIVPVVGPVISLVFAMLVAAFDSPAKLIAVTGFYLVYQQLENAFLTPKIMTYSVDLPPLAVVVALAIGGALAGILGALIAVPTAALLAVLADEYLVKKKQLG